MGTIEIASGRNEWRPEYGVVNEYLCEKSPYLC